MHAILVRRTTPLVPAKQCKKIQVVATQIQKDTTNPKISIPWIATLGDLKRQILNPKIVLGRSAIFSPNLESIDGCHDLVTTAELFY
jgi:hypothetical protein